MIPDNANIYFPQVRWRWTGSEEKEGLEVQIFLRAVTKCKLKTLQYGVLHSQVFFWFLLGVESVWTDSLDVDSKRSLQCRLSLVVRTERVMNPVLTCGYCLLNSGLSRVLALLYNHWSQLDYLNCGTVVLDEVWRAKVPQNHSMEIL